MTTENIGEGLEAVGQDTVPQTAEQVATTLAREPTPEEIEAYISSLDDARASQLDPINRRVRGFIASESKKLEKEQRAQQEQVQQQWAKRNAAQAWMNQLQGLTEGEQFQHLRQPQIAKQYAENVELLSTQPAPAGYKNPDEVAKLIWENAKQDLMQHEHFQDVNWEEIEGKPPAEALSSLILAGSEKRVKRMEEEFKKAVSKEVQAAIQAEMGKLNLKASEPDRLEPAGGASGGLTLQQYLNMSGEEKAKLSSADIDRAIANR